MHRTGHRDRNLDPRNLLVRRDPEGFVFAKIDSPRSFRVCHDIARDRTTASDLGRLARGLHELAVAPELLVATWPALVNA
jgi:hypothetical protein